MNFYAKKQRWKLLLAGTAIIIVAASLWYTNVLVQKIAAEEREKVQLWAEAIQNKASLVKYTTSLFTKIKAEERNKIELWAEANKRAATSNNNDDLTFYLDILSRNKTIPVLVVDDKERIVNWRNFDLLPTTDTVQYLANELAQMKLKHAPIELVYHIPGYTSRHKLYYKDSKIFSELKEVLDDLIESFISEIVINSAAVPVIYTDSTQQQVIEYGNLEDEETKDSNFFLDAIAKMRKQNEPIPIAINEQTTNYIFYKDSNLLQQLKYYPFFQFFIIGLFLIISYYLFSTSRNIEQNQVWVGMAKETAHQLGTPLSSLMAWVEYLKLKNVDENTLNELSKDITRLEVITERFSKIGSTPKLENKDIKEVINTTLAYLKVRISKKVHITLVSENKGPIEVKVNASLFSWVLENLIKNATDAMKGNGEITIHIIDQTQFIYIDVTDTGIGIPKSKQKTIFEPGFTTKKRGWGLGLSLVKRIVENYHSGKIFVKQSNEKGSTFRIVLNK